MSFKTLTKEQRSRMGRAAALLRHYGLTEKQLEWNRFARSKNQAIMDKYPKRLVS